MGSTNYSRLSQYRSNNYEGEYVEDKKHGYGVFEWESGNVYSGFYNNDERHGYGVMRWTDSSTYMGTWEAGIQQGVGIMIFADGTRRAGFFDQNLFVKSIKQNSDIDPYRAILDPECIAELEKFVEEYQ